MDQNQYEYNLVKLRFDLLKTNLTPTISKDIGDVLTYAIQNDQVNNSDLYILLFILLSNKDLLSKFNRLQVNLLVSQIIFNSLHSNCLNKLVNDNNNTIIPNTVDFNTDRIDINGMRPGMIYKEITPTATGKIEKVFEKQQDGSIKQIEEHFLSKPDFSQIFSNILGEEILETNDDKNLTENDL